MFIDYEIISIVIKIIIHKNKIRNLFITSDILHNKALSDRRMVLEH